MATCRPASPSRQRSSSGSAGGTRSWGGRAGSNRRWLSVSAGRVWRSEGKREQGMWERRAGNLPTMDRRRPLPCVQSQLRPAPLHLELHLLLLPRGSRGGASVHRLERAAQPVQALVQALAAGGNRSLQAARHETAGSGGSSGGKREAPHGCCRHTGCWHQQVPPQRTQLPLSDARCLLPGSCPSPSDTPTPPPPSPARATCGPSFAGAPWPRTPPPATAPPAGLACWQTPGWRCAASAGRPLFAAARHRQGGARRGGAGQWWVAGR